MSLDLVIRNARVVTASDVFDCDIGVADGRIAALARGLTAPRGDRRGRAATCSPVASMRTAISTSR